MAALFIWLASLTWLLLYMRRRYLRLVGGIDKPRWDRLLEDVLNKHDVAIEHLDALRAQIDELDDASKSHIQKIGLVRFNAFGKVGSEQSFVLALLDGRDTGVLMNFIYAHDGVRVYTKEVSGGSSKGRDFSQEEQSALAEAT